MDTTQSKPKSPVLASIFNTVFPLICGGIGTLIVCASTFGYDSASDPNQSAFTSILQWINFLMILVCPVIYGGIFIFNIRLLRSGNWKKATIMSLVVLGLVILSASLISASTGVNFLN